MPAPPPAAVALVDCNAFYASCEAAFDPALAGRPFVVLSNNDGCVIARSPAAKALGIPMGAPAFRVARDVRRHGVALYSSNYALYGDLSARVMETLGTFSPRVEVYSIDEAFVDLGHVPAAGRAAYARAMRDTVRRWTGIPVGVGIGPTKTLAKLANRLAKHSAKADGVLDVTRPRVQAAALAATEIGAVWGIGRRRAAMLRIEKVLTAGEFADADDAWIRRRMGIVGLRTACELRGETCLSLDDAPAPRLSCCVTRTFGEAVTAKADVAEAVAAFTARAAEKLRRERLAAAHVQVFVSADRFRPELPQYAGDLLLTPDHPTNHTGTLARLTRRAVDVLFREGIGYRRAGVLCLGLQPAAQVVGSLFERPDERGAQVDAAVDAINRRYGRGTVRRAGEGVGERPWLTRRQYLSPCYTTRLADVPVARA